MSPASRSRSRAAARAASAASTRPCTSSSRRVASASKRPSRTPIRAAISRPRSTSVRLPAPLPGACDAMKRPLWTAVLGWCCSLLLSLPAATAVPEIAFESVPDFLTLPKDVYLGEVAGIAVNSRRHVFVLSRGNTAGPAYGAAAAQLLEFDPQGRFVREIGHNLYAWSYAHSVRVDPHDNVWIVDKGSDMVVRFDPAGRVSRVFGRKAEAADESAPPLPHPNPPLPPVDGLFRQVTDVTWDDDDNVYISDGYINSYIAKYDRVGQWIGAAGEPGVGPGQFKTPHSIVSDRQHQL